MRTLNRAREGRGFILIETIASFAILTLALASFATTVVVSLENFRNAEQKYVASKMAEEGIELVLNKATNNLLCLINQSCSLTTWEDNLIGDFEVDASQTNLLLPSQTFNPYNATHYLCVVSGSSQDGKFGYCGNSSYLSPKYTREVAVTSLGSNVIRITSTVRWGGGKSLSVEMLKFND